MRGTLTWLYETIIKPGLIPTYAGNTAAKKRGAAHDGAHPHVCGEHLILQALCDGLKGSSPRMRGTPNTTNAIHSSQGLIPTYAGNTRRARWWPQMTGAHPHVCGEHFVSLRCAPGQLGSSPRMRGTPHGFFLGGWLLGLIPTYAGNTCGVYPCQVFFRAHPHVCGEHAPEFR